MSCVRVLVLQRGHSDDGCDWESTLCKYDFRKGDLFVLSLASVQTRNNTTVLRYLHHTLASLKR